MCNSYTMGCPPVHGDNPRALASGLSYVQVDKHGITILYHLHQLARRKQLQIGGGGGGTHKFFLQIGGAHIIFFKMTDLCNEQYSVPPPYPYGPDQCRPCTSSDISC